MFGINALFNNIEIFPVIIGKFFIPAGLPMFPYFDIYSIIIGIIAIALLIFLGVKFFKEKRWLFIIGLSWFFLFTLVPLFFRQKLFEYSIICVDQRVYLPAIGIIFLLSSSVGYYIETYRKPAFYVIAAVVIAFSWVTYNHSNDYKNSFYFCSAAIEKNPNNAMAYTYLGFSYFNYAKNISYAIMDFNRAIEICNYPKAYFNRGVLLLLMNNNVDAENDFTRAILEDSTLDLCYLNRANARFALHNYQGALEDLNKASEKDPDNPEIYFGRGKLFSTITDYKEALPDYDKCISLNPKYINAYYYRASARYLTGDIWGSIQDCKKLLTIDSTDLNVLKNLGQAYREVHRYKESIDTYNKAIGLDNRYAPAIFGRGITKQAMNDMKGACQDWQDALKLGFYPAKEMLDKFCK
jgi:tetratricopeptide (TPR) repeat protein